MDFWETYERKAEDPTFGQKQLLLKTGDRYTASIARYQERSRSIEVGNAFLQDYFPEKRYLIAQNIIFDLLVTFYDVNSKRIFALRLANPINDEELHKVKSSLSRLKEPNLEMRAIGLQNGDKTLVGSIEKLYKSAKCSIAEIDLFGNSMRHVIIDLLTGKPYNLLLLNRIYRPGELNITVPKPNYEEIKLKLNFL